MLASSAVGHHDGRCGAMVGKGKRAYTALVANIRLLAVDSDLAETLRVGSEHFRGCYELQRRVGVSSGREGADSRTVPERCLG